MANRSKKFGMKTNVKNPFKLFAPYTKDDQDHFFGRENAIDELYELLKLTNLLVVYGPRGTGKTSLIQSGLAGRMEGEWVCLVIKRGENILESTAAGLLEAFGSNPPEKDSDIPDLVEDLYYDKLAPIFLVFDQFEDLFASGTEEEREAFFNLVDTLISSRLKVKIIMILHEEYKAFLDKYESIVEQLLTYRFRLESMTWKEAEALILQMCETEGITLEQGVEDEMISLLKKGGSEKSFKLFYLQVLLYFLYEDALDRDPDKIVFDKSLVQGIGAFSELNSRLLKKQIEQLGREIGSKRPVWQFLKAFVTIDGAKKYLTRQSVFDTLKNHGNEEQISNFLESFSGSHIIRLVDKEKYELTDDSIALEISRERVQLPLKNPEIKDPYKGLLPYEGTDKVKFFGRSKIVDELVEKVRNQSLVILVGDTGSGKSSLTRAGLLPRLKEEGYHIFDVIRPGSNPLIELKKKVIDRLSSIPEDSKGAIATIDQYEEIFTRIWDEEKRAKFSGELKKLLNAHNLKVVLTLRIDFEREAKNELGEFWKAARYPVPIPTYNEYVEIIQEPAFKAGCYFDPPSLIDNIAQEASTVTIALPLLSFFLNRLYDESGESGVFTHEVYSRIGNVTEALSNFADNLYRDLDEPKQKVMKKVMLRMVSLKGTELASKRISRSELEYENKVENKRVDEVIDSLVKHGLVKEGQDLKGEEEYKYIEPPHDALLWGWGKLKEWSKEEESNILLRDQLQTSINKWENQNQAKEYLWDSDPSLYQLKNADWLNKKETLFRNKSIGLKQKKQNLKIWGAVGLGIILISLIFGFYQAKLKNTELEGDLKVQKANADKQAQQRLAKSSELTSYSIIESNIDRTLALNLAKAAADSVSDNGIANKVLADIVINSFAYPFYKKLIDAGQDYITVLAISPDEKQFLSAGSDGSLCLRSMDGDTVWRKKIHSKSISVALFSPDGREILCGGRDGKVFLFQRNGQDPREFDCKNSVTSGDFTPDGQYFITSDNFGRIKVWNRNQPASPVRSWKIHKAKISGLAYFNNPPRIVTSGNDYRLILTNYFSGDSLFEVVDSTVWVTTLSKAPGDSIFAVGLLNGMVQLWKARDSSFHQLLTFKAHEGKVGEIVFSADGKKLATFGQDKKAKLWDTKGNLLKTLLGHRDALLCGDMAKNADVFLTGGEDRTIKVWEPKNPEILDIPVPRGEGATSVDFLPSLSNDERYQLLSSRSDSYWAIWNPDGSKIREIKELEGGVNELKASSDGKYILLAGDSPDPILYDRNGKVIIKFNAKELGHPNRTRGVAFFPGNQLVSTCYDKGQVVIWNLDGKALLIQKAHERRVEDIAISPDGKWMLTAGHDHLIKIWEISGEGSTLNMTLFKQIEGHQDLVECVAFHPDTLLFLSGSWDNSFKLWNLDGELIHTFIGHTSDIQALAFSPDGETILSASSDNTVRLWTMDGKEKLSIIQQNNSIWDAVFSPDGKYILTACKDGTVKLWPVDGSKALEGIPGLTENQKKLYGLE